jgi:hypothetical protein
VLTGHELLKHYGDTNSVSRPNDPMGLAKLILGSGYKTEQLHGGREARGRLAGDTHCSDLLSSSGSVKTVLRETGIVLSAWRNTTKYVARAPSEFMGRDKETNVFRNLRQQIEQLEATLQITGPDFQNQFDAWRIDLVCSSDACRIAVEGKYKIMRDGAVPDNRKAAFFDLFKLEKYVSSGKYATGLFLWLTNVAAYRQRATGDSADFSTHQGRVYEPGTKLRAARSRNDMPLPLVLNSRVCFDWEPVDSLGHWFSIAIMIGPGGGQS